MAAGDAIGTAGGPDGRREDRRDAGRRSTVFTLIVLVAALLSLAIVIDLLSGNSPGYHRSFDLSSGDRVFVSTTVFGIPTRRRDQPMLWPCEPPPSWLRNDSRRDLVYEGDALFQDIDWFRGRANRMIAAHQCDPSSTPDELAICESLNAAVEFVMSEHRAGRDWRAQAPRGDLFEWAARLDSGGQ